VPHYGGNKQPANFNSYRIKMHCHGKRNRAVRKETYVR